MLTVLVIGSVPGFYAEVKRSISCCNCCGERVLVRTIDTHKRCRGNANSLPFVRSGVRSLTDGPRTAISSESLVMMLLELDHESAKDLRFSLKSF